MIFSLIVFAVAGVLVRALIPGRKTITAFLVSAVLGPVGAFLASVIGRSIGWYSPGEGTGFLGALLGSALLIGFWQLTVNALNNRPSAKRREANVVSPRVGNIEPVFSRGTLDGESKIAKLEQLAALRSSHSIDDAEYKLLKNRIIGTEKSDPTI